MGALPNAVKQVEAPNHDTEDIAKRWRAWRGEPPRLRATGARGERTPDRREAGGPGITTGKTSRSDGAAGAVSRRVTSPRRCRAHPH